MHTQYQTRAEARRRLGPWRRSPPTTVLKFAACLVGAAVLAFLPEHSGMSAAARDAFFILCLGAGLWLTEAIPAYAVALLLIALEIALLGRPGGAYAVGPNDWEVFVRPFGSPLIWLFFGGFVLAKGAARTGIDRKMALALLGRFGTRPTAALFVIMAVTFTFSMFISNTAATAAMIAVITPLVLGMKGGDPFAKAFLLGVPFAANLGGLGTVIGSPPNAIAAGALEGVDPVTFTEWIVVGLPPALVLLAVAFVYLRLRYRPSSPVLDVSALEDSEDRIPPLHAWHPPLVVAVFLATVLLWMTGPIHGMPSTVVSFLPITAFTVFGVLRSAEIRELPWEVLLLLAGGLSLGVAVTNTGLADWLVTRLPIDALGPAGVAVLMAYLTCVLSNFMSNTAAANILVPIALVVSAGSASLVVPIALASSCAMAMPVSTPPNAIAYATGRIKASDFLLGGAILGLLGPGIATIWAALVMP